MRELRRIIVEQVDQRRGPVSELPGTGRIDPGTLPVPPEPAAVTDLVRIFVHTVRRTLGDSAENPAGLFHLRGVRWDGRLVRLVAHFNSLSLRRTRRYPKRDTRYHPGLRRPPLVKEPRMNKSDLSSHVANQTSLSKAQASAVVDAVFSAISDSLVRDESVAIAGFGTFSTKTRGARQGRNPRTGERIALAASRSPSFKAGKTFRDAVRG